MPTMIFIKHQCSKYKLSLTGSQQPSSLQISNGAHKSVNYSYYPRYMCFQSSEKLVAFKTHIPSTTPSPQSLHQLHRDQWFKVISVLPFYALLWLFFVLKVNTYCSNKGACDSSWTSSMSLSRYDMAWQTNMEGRGGGRTPCSSTGEEDWSFGSRTVGRELEGRRWRLRRLDNELKVAFTKR